MNKYIVLIVAIIFLGSGCKKKYEEGFNAGKIDGLAQGRIDGEQEGYADGHIQGISEVYDTAFDQGMEQGLIDGYQEGSDYFATAGYDEGHSDGYYDGGIQGHMDGYDIGYNSAYNHHYDVQYDIGEDDGYSDGRSDGLDDGYDDGYSDGGNDGYDDNYNDGWNDGYDDGYSDGYGSSVKSNNPSVKLAAMVNADLIDYTKLAKFDSKSIVSVGMSHADNGTVDMEKLAALKEKHYLNQMGRQIQAKFGLSSDRSLKIAKVAHQFNQLSGSRELTEKDAELFAVGVMGASMKDVEVAMKKSMKGESELFDKLLNDIASHNGTTPEKVNGIISQIFF